MKSSRSVKRSKKRLAACLLMAFVMSLIASYPSFAAWQVVPAGWQASEDGYFCTLEDGADTLAAIRAYKSEAQAWQAAYAEIKKDIQEYRSDTQGQLKALEEEFNKERLEWKKEQAKERFYIIGAFVLGAAIGSL